MTSLYQSISDHLNESIIGSNDASIFINDKYKKFFDYLDKNAGIKDAKRQLRYTLIFTSYELAEQYMSWIGSDNEPSVKTQMDIEKILDRNPGWRKITGWKWDDDYWWYNKKLADKYGISYIDIKKANKEI